MAPNMDFRAATAKWAALGFSITDEDLAVLKRDLAQGDCDLCRFPVIFQLIGSLEDAHHNAAAEPKVEPTRGTTRSCPRCGDHTRFTGYAWEHVSEGETGAGQLSCTGLELTIPDH